MNAKLSMLILIAALSVCSCSDQFPYTRHIAWEDACIVNHSSTNTYRILKVSTGSNLVLEVTEGLTRSLLTTAHGGHDSLYLILSSPPEAGDSFKLFFADGTLDYDGFGGYGFNVIDTNMPAVAEISVYKVSERYILADVSAALWQRNTVGHDSNSPSQLFVTKGKMRFDRKKP